ncbi:MAG: hypothetical protein U0930_02325 [Pirellulales bacterium]
MTLHRITIREIMLLTAIAALLIPFIYSKKPEAVSLDLSYNTIQKMVSQIEPNSRIQFGSGGSEMADLNYLIPKDSADKFFENLRTEIEKHIKTSGWGEPGGSKTVTNGNLTGFGYDLKKGSVRCAVQGILLSRNECKDVLFGKDVEEVRFIILSPQVR